MKKNIRNLFYVFICTVICFSAFTNVYAGLNEDHGNEAVSEILQKPGSSGTEKPSFLGIKPNVLFWTFVTFGVLIIVLGKFGWKPIIGALDSRMEKIKNDIDDAEARRNEANNFLVEQKELLGNARAEAEGIIDKAKVTAIETKDDIIDKANKEAQNLSDSAKKEIEHAKTKAIVELRDEVGKLSLEIASKVIGKALSPKDHNELIMKVLSQYQNEN